MNMRVIENASPATPTRYRKKVRADGSVDAPASPRPDTSLIAWSGPHSGEAVEDGPFDPFDGDPLLGHRIAVADRHRPVFEGVDIDRDAPWGADLVLATVELADGRRVVVDGHHVALEVGLDLVAQVH